MKKQIINRFLLIIGIAIVSIFISTSSDFKVVLGLDLAGGSELDYKIDLSDAIKQNSDDIAENDVNLNAIAESVRDALEKRVNPAGIGEIIVRRSQINEDEHIIIQMPPSSNVNKAKQSASKNNKLEFYKEDPNKSNNLEPIRESINVWNWEEKKKELISEGNEHIAKHVKVGPYFENEILDPALAKKLMGAGPNTLLEGIIETKTDTETTIRDGQLQIVSFPEPIFAIVKINSKKAEEHEKYISPEAHVRHILFGYPEAQRASEDIRYKTKEEALIKATEILEKLKTDGTEDFENLAKEYSTEGAAIETGGDLGKFEPGRMVSNFNDAVFTDTAEAKLLPELVETDFGFHIIEILEFIPESTENVLEPKVEYEMITWKADEFGWIPTKLGGKQLDNATVGYNEIGQPLVNLLFDSEGGDLFADITADVAAQKCDNSPCRLGIKVGNVWITKPTVRERIVGRQAQITGNFTFESAKELSDGLNLGAIDAPVILSGQTTITPELGADQLQKSLKAGLYGFIATMLFMIILYRYAGIIAAFSLSIYALIFISILKTWPVSFGGPIVLTLSGIAGVVLSLGLAVDGNILIFERIKEEFLKGRSIHEAIDLGFERAWTAIRDSNLTTLITCIILFSLGSSIIKGFAITLIVGTLLSMFTAIIISRNLLRFSSLFKFFEKKNIFGITKVETTKSKKGIKIRNR